MISLPGDQRSNLYFPKEELTFPIENGSQIKSEETLKLDAGNSDKSLKKHRSIIFKCQERVSKAVSHFHKHSGSTPHSTEVLQSEIKKQIIELKEKKRILAKTFEHIQQFIEADPELLFNFKNALEQSRGILLPPPSEDQSAPVNHPLAEEWRVEAQKQNYFEAMKTRFHDFLEKNPEFSDLFHKKYEEALKEKEINIFSSDPFAPESLSSSSQKISEIQEESENLNQPELVLKSQKSKWKFKHYISSFNKIFSSDSSQDFELRLLRSFKQENEEQLHLLMVLKRLIETDNELIPIFKQWLESFSALKNPSNNSNLIQSCKMEADKAYRLASMRADFLDLLEKNPHRKEVFLEKMQQLSEGNMAIMQSLLKSKVSSKPISGSHL